jgi:hypothetical protein
MVLCLLTFYLRYTSDSSVEVKRQMSDTLSSLTHENMSVVLVSMAPDFLFRLLKYFSKLITGHFIPPVSYILPPFLWYIFVVVGFFPSHYISCARMSEPAVEIIILKAH